MADPLATWGGWEPAIRDDPFGHFAEARTRCPVQQMRLADGHPAWVVLGYDAARQALNDPRISKDMLAALEEAGDVVAEGLPGPEFSYPGLSSRPGSPRWRLPSGASPTTSSTRWTTPARAPRSTSSRDTPTPCRGE
jgi:hypothetical protein